MRSRGTAPGARRSTGAAAVQPVTSDLKGSAARGAVWSVVQQWGKRVSALLVFVVLVRLLDPADFGLLAIAAFFVALAAIVQEQGFSAAVVQREDLEDEHLDTAFAFSVTSGLLLFGLVQAVAGPLAALFDDAPGLEPVLRVLSCVFLLSALQSTQAAILRRRLEFRALAVRDLAAQVVGGVAGITAALLGAGVWALVVQQVVAQATAVVTLWASSPWRPGRRLSLRHLGDLWSFGWKVLGTQLLGFTQRRSDDLLIGAFLGTVQLGLYTVAYRVLTLLTELFVNTISSVAAPTFARLQTERERIARAYLSASRMAALLAVPAFVGVSALAPEITRTLFGAQYASVAPVMRVLALVGVVHGITWLASSVMTAMGKPGWNLSLGLVNTVLNVSLFFLAIQLGWGILGVAAVFTVRAYVTFPAHLVCVRRLTGVRLRDWLRSLAPVLLAGGALFGAAVGTTALLGDDVLAPVRLVVGGLAGAVTYVAVVALLARSLPVEALSFIRAGRSSGPRRTAPARVQDHPDRASSGAGASGEPRPPAVTGPRTAAGVVD